VTVVGSQVFHNGYLFAEIVSDGSSWYVRLQINLLTIASDTACE
jgi:hypothetical protein